MIASAHRSGAAIVVPWWGWVALLVGLGVLLLVDLLVLHRNATVPTLRRTSLESAGWIGLGVGFGLIVWFVFGSAASGEYYAGYLIEKSLSIDNVFVWALILRYFAVPRAYQHRVLFWGVFAALGLRAAFIFGGVAILNRLEWVLYLFGAFLVFTAIRLLVVDESEMDPGSSRALRVARRFIPSTDRYDGQRLFTHVDGRRMATPLFFVLVVIEVSDILFAVDSVPAILAVSRDQFVVFASNAFAILGLRSLYFLLADLHERFRYLQEGLAVILAFVGVKMLISNWVHIPIGWSLATIAAVMVITITASVLRPTPTDEADHDAEGSTPTTSRSTTTTTST